MQTIASIDVGSNAIRIAVGRVDERGKVDVIENVRLPVRLGQDAFASGTLGEETIARAVEAFGQFQRIIRDTGVSRVRAVATSAMREAANRDILIDRIAQNTRIDVEVISGEEEARLIYLAVANAVDLKGKHAMLIDIGGGSVEVTLADGQKILTTDSYNLGTVRMLEKLGQNGNDTLSFEKLAREYAEAARGRIEREIGHTRIDLCIGTGGNVEELGNLRQRLFKRDSDKVITVDELEAIIDQLKVLTPEERMREFKLRPDRADVILPAAIALRLIAREGRVKEIRIPNVGLKDGLLIDMAEEIGPGEQPLRRDQVWASAIQMGRKYQFDERHGKLIAQLVTRLFDETRPIHQLDDESRLLLEVAALLHDIGHFIHTVDHDKHGYYLLNANSLIGLNERQQAIVANIVRYHRKSSPGGDDPTVKPLPYKDRLTAIRLIALLRLADAMDASRTARVSDISIEQKKGGLALKLIGNGDFMLEKWTLTKRKAFFAESFGVRLDIED
jgi:exopolyphosphatase/guanosine-5'-triphosphate,3'-diphosphate pyrophosphatase